MRIAELIRLEESEQGTLGVLKIDKEVFCYTLEPPDRVNEQDRSSIPAQQYRCEPHHSRRYGQTYQVTAVPGRTAILFHAGNVGTDTAGCILLGETVGKLKGNRAVLNSGATFKRFMEAAGVSGPAFSLTIREVY